MLEDFNMLDGMGYELDERGYPIITEVKALNFETFLWKYHDLPLRWYYSLVDEQRLILDKLYNEYKEKFSI